MKYKEPQILLEVRKIKEQLQKKREIEGADAFFQRINRRVAKPAATTRRKLSKPGR